MIEDQINNFKIQGELHNLKTKIFTNRKKFNRYFYLISTLSLIKETFKLKEEKLCTILMLLSLATVRSRFILKKIILFKRSFTERVYVQNKIWSGDTNNYYYLSYNKLLFNKK